MPPFESLDLEEGWRLRQTKTGEEEAWMPVQRVPTNVHLDLMYNKKIPDPFIGFNELDVEWIGETSWTYRVILPEINAGHDDEKVVLAFDGLDTFATVKLNDIVVLTSDNMFIPFRVDVTERLRYGQENVLEIRFDSAIRRAKEIKEAYPGHKWVCFNGDPARLAVRKAQYHWGWDWGPMLNTCGPWRPVRLERYKSRISDLRIDYELDADLRVAHGTISARVEGNAVRMVRLSASLSDKIVFKHVIEVDGEGPIKVEFRVDEPKLWYPHGYGGQPLYEVTAVVSDGELDLATTSHRIGFRKGELIQHPDDVGKTFFLRINGIDVFCGGSDWIPADSFTPRISNDGYRKWLQMMVDGNQMMIRVWGGGIWEDDIFYDLCDELGILVWQDFLFACGNYPAFPSFLESVRSECIANVRRIRHHPSIVIFAGNNEDYQVQESFGLTYDYEDKNPENWLKTNFPARYIYEKLLPEVVQAEGAHVPYHPGSPWGDGLPTSNRTVGDLHQWNVWHGTQEKYQIFDSLGGRFNSEFGMEAFPHIDTIKHYCTDDSQLYPQSQILDFHNKADGHERRIATYVVENFRTVTELKVWRPDEIRSQSLKRSQAFIHLTQLSQAEALSFGYRGWRRQWGQKRFCGGALVWQLNDCWPVTSWSIVDYFQLKKPAYYTMRRALAPLAVAVKRAHHDWSVVHARPAKSSDYQLWVASSKLEEKIATVELRFVSISTGKDIKDPILWKDIRIAANGTTEIHTGAINHTREEPHVLAARLFIDDELVSRDTDWPQPLKYLDFSDRGVQVSQDGKCLRISAKKPTKGFVFEEHTGITFDDSALDVVPGDEQVVYMTRLGDDDSRLDWTYLGRGAELGC